MLYTPDKLPLEDVLCTAELYARPLRQPDHAMENRRLCTLMDALADSPRTILQTIGDIMLATFNVGSTGISLVAAHEDSLRLNWLATAGIWKAHLDGAAPGEMSAGDGGVPDLDVPKLLRRPQRHYVAFDGVPRMEECLVAPFYVSGKAAGLVWLVSHDIRRTFDSEDLRQLVNLSRFATSAHRAVMSAGRMLEMNEALLLGSLRQHELTQVEETLNRLLHAEILVRQHAEMELNKAKAVADSANLAKSDFLSNMNHELRTPLNSILGFAQLLTMSKPPLSPLQQRSVEHIVKAGWFLTGLVNETLDLAMVESGNLSLAMDAVPLHDVLRECLAMVEPQALDRGITMSVPPYDASIVVHADPTRLMQVLNNLLSNAVKYNKTAGTIVVQHEARAPGRLRISVVDSGPGLTADQLSQLFQLFNRLGHDGHKIQGTGIGLVVARSLTELMGGTAGAESMVGQGSTFWIELNTAVPRAGHR